MLTRDKLRSAVRDQVQPIVDSIKEKIAEGVRDFSGELHRLGNLGNALAEKLEADIPAEDSAPELETDAPDAQTANATASPAAPDPSPATTTAEPATAQATEQAPSPS